MTKLKIGQNWKIRQNWKVGQKNFENDTFTYRIFKHMWKYKKKIIENNKTIFITLLISQEAWPFFGLFCF